MAKYSERYITDDDIIIACEESLTMAEAASKTGLHFNTFRRRATKLEVYAPNIGGKGMSKNRPVVVSLDDILSGKAPWFQSYKLKNRLIKDGMKENKCEKCGITEWLGAPLQCELNHINGIRHDHKWENLEILCPNCHSQTDTFRAKNKKI
jgi:hypothetical protein